ncbi:hypothetical protein WJX81_001225 [Elliptochloris bilobata]|uniref:Uncharacterized protein n=1 Tax=Elliptochloris bilobata TaxID=381761 RepID=A0AAW1S1D8_9CHLO
MNTQAISSISGTSVLGDRSQLLRSRVPHRVARPALAPAAQAWKKDNDGARPDAKSFVKEGSRLLASLAAVQLVAFPIAGSAVAQVAARPLQVLPEMAQAKPNPESRNLGPNEVNADSINDISAYASDQDKFAPGRAGTTFGDPEAAAKGDTSKETQFKKSAGDFSADSSGGGAPDIGSTPPTLTEKIKEVFGVSEVPNPESSNLGPNEVNADSINEISAYASDQDKFSPGRAGTTFGDPEAAAKGDTSKEAQFKKSAGDFSRDESGGGAPDIGSTPQNLTDKVKEVFGLSEATINPESRNLGPNEVDTGAIDEISAYASDADKATPGRAGSTFGDPVAASKGDTSAATQFKKSAGDASEGVTRAVSDAGSQAGEAGSGIKSKIAALFNVSEVNPDSQNLGPNEVGQEAIDRITPDASSFDKAAPGRSGSTFGNPAAAGRGDTSAATQFTKTAGDATKDTIGKALGGDAKTQASSTGLLGRFKALFNLSEASDPQNPSPSDVSKDIASRLGGGGGISAIDEQSPGRATTQQGGTQEVGQGFNQLKQGVKEGAQKVGDVKSVGDKLKEALPGLSELPSPGQAVQAGKDLVSKLPSGSDIQGAAQADKPDLLEQGIRGALAKAPDDLSDPKGAPYTKAASDAIKEKVGSVFGSK